MCIVLYSALLTPLFFLFFFNDTATTEIYTLSLHDALPISARKIIDKGGIQRRIVLLVSHPVIRSRPHLEARSEEHTSELQSHLNLVCRLLLEKKKTTRGRTSSESACNSNSYPSTLRASRAD